jgi:hypothetical protein
MKTLIKLVIVALIINACWHAGNAFLRYYRFKDEVHSTALFQSSRSDTELQARVQEIANQIQVPVLPEDIVIRRRENHTMIDATYTEQLELIPKKVFPWKFNVKVDAFTIDQAPPPTPGR